MPAAPGATSGTESATGTVPAVGSVPLVGGEDLAVDGALNLIKPVRGAVEGSGFGMRYHPVLHVWKMHNGTDFPVACGTPVYASATGVVTLAQYHGASGNAVEIDHGDLNGGGAGSNFATHYFHLSAFGVHAGDHVVQGQFIGLSGTTGRSTGCHLHWEVRIDGRYVDPMSVIGNGEPVYGAEGTTGEPQQTWSEPLPPEDEQYRKDAERDRDPEGASPSTPAGTPASPAPEPAPATPTEPPRTQRPAGSPASTSPATTSPAVPPTTTTPVEPPTTTPVEPPTTTPVEPPTTTPVEPPTTTPPTETPTTTPPTETPTTTPPPTETPTTAPPTEAPSTTPPATDPPTSTPVCPDPTLTPTATPTADPSGEPSATPDCTGPTPTTDPMPGGESSERG